MAFNIAIDGPAGAGKSTIARALAKRLSYIYVDTGAMYRAMALYLLREGISAEDSGRIEEACERVDISIIYEDNVQKVLLNGEDVSSLIRSEEVGNMASRSAQNGRVREKLVELQRQLAAKTDVVMDGRDIGTNVFRDAEYKIFLTASAKERAERRFEELTAKGQKVDFDEVLRDIEKRDHDDMTRALNPLRKAEDAVEIDTTGLSIDEVIERVLKEIK